MKRIALIAVVAFATFGALARAEKPKRFPFESPSFGFAVTYPYSETSVQTGLGGSMVASSVGPDGTTYAVLTMPVPAELAQNPVKEQLDFVFAAAAARAGGKLAGQKDVELGGHVGREASIRSKTLPTALRVYVIGKTLYTLAITHKPGDRLPMPPAEFFASFELRDVK